MKFRGVFHPVLIAPARIPDLNVLKYTNDGQLLFSEIENFFAIKNAALFQSAEQLIPKHAWLFPRSRGLLPTVQSRMALSS